METVLYELKPYACASLGLFAVVAMSGLASVLGALLLGLSCLILKMRRTYRRARNVAARH